MHRDNHCMRKYAYYRTKDLRCVTGAWVEEYRSLAHGILDLMWPSKSVCILGLFQLKTLYSGELVKIVGLCLYSIHGKSCNRLP